MSVITISRQFGAAGKTIGRRVADTLGYYYADEDIIDRAAVEVSVSPDGKKILETEPSDKVKRFISKLNPFGTSLMELNLSDKERYIDGFKYVELLNLIIPKIAKDGNAVIVGRGGQYILHDFENTYHILLIVSEKFSVGDSCQAVLGLPDTTFNFGQKVFVKGRCYRSIRIVFNHN